LNFGTILNSITKNCVALVIECRDEDSKSLAMDFIKYIQLKEVLRKQFYVYNQLNSSFIKDRESAKTFVVETFSIFDGYSFEDILSYNHLLESKFNVVKIPSTDIDMAISKVIKYRTSMEKVNQLEYVESLNKIIEHVSTVRDFDDKLSTLSESAKNSQLKFLQPKHVVRIALKRFNERYSSNFDEEDRVVFNTLREGDKDKIEWLYSDTYQNLLSEYQKFNIENDKELQDKITSALQKVGNSLTQENLLNAYELCSELRKLNENR